MTYKSNENKYSVELFAKNFSDSETVDVFKHGLKNLNSPP